MDDHIDIHGAADNNLQKISLRIPLHKLTLITGVSGSGKSTLAFDTLAAEGQRRYIETFSPQARQYFTRLPQPNVDRIENLPPAVALRQKTSRPARRETIASTADLLNSMALLFSKLGEIVCPDCARLVQVNTPESVTDAVNQFGEGLRIQIAFPYALEQHETAKSELLSLGFDRIVSGNKTISLRDSSGEMEADCLVLVDRLATGKIEPSRLRDSLEQAFQAGAGQCVVLVESKETQNSTGDRLEIDGREWERFPFSSDLSCSGCSRIFLQPEPRLFNNRSPLGACPTCQGEGVETKTAAVCPECRGAGLRPEALAVRVQQRTITDVLSDSVTESRTWFQQLQQDLTEANQRLTETVFSDLFPRLDVLAESGLTSLTLNRSLRSLSRGEARRVTLTSILSAQLVNSLYLLDEPTAGLHPSETMLVLRLIQRLQKQGNTVVVVEHDPAFLTIADHVIELGPGAGAEGGAVVFQGTVAEFLDHVQPAAENADGLPSAEKRTIRSATEWLTLSGGRQHNLQDITVKFPLGVCCVVTGVSGSGKSTLVEHTLYPHLCQQLEQSDAFEIIGSCDSLTGSEHLDEVLLLDHSTIGQTSRSLPVTYLKAFDEIRQVFAETADSKVRNYTPSQFSFNSAQGGRCEKCKGLGVISIDMQFLADVNMTCPECDGQRFQREVLEVKYRNRTIADVLNMTVSEAFSFFRGQSKLQKKLQVLKDVGLDYLRLGQPAQTLSGGESQRLKLAARLSTSSRKRTLFILDEPTTGLHEKDVARLLSCFDSLLAIGHSLVIIEHHPSVILAADHVIDLGPGAGAEGGMVTFTGTPAALLNNADLMTATALRSV